MVVNLMQLFFRFSSFSSFRSSYLLLFSCFLTGCSSQQAQTLHGSGYDFSQVKTYSLFERNSAFTEQQNIHHRLRNMLELVIEQNFERAGFQYQPLESADIIVSYQFSGIALIKSLKSRSTVNLCPLCQPEPSADKRSKDGREMRSLTRDELTLRSADEKQRLGDLLINIIDTKTMLSVWRGQYPLNIGDKDDSQKTEEKIRNAMQQIMVSMLKPAEGK